MYCTITILGIFPYSQDRTPETSYKGYRFFVKLENQNHQNHIHYWNFSEKMIFIIVPNISRANVTDNNPLREN
ncbi:unnamed protein product [Rhizophagus irregularis]|nr:unnamed protein product [Rhizophagus irregularis]